VCVHVRVGMYVGGGGVRCLRVCVYVFVYVRLCVRESE
jgi:hypothetical protein